MISGFYLEYIAGKTQPDWLNVMEQHVGPDSDVAADRLLQLFQHRALLLTQRARNVGVHAQQQRLTVQIAADLLHLGQNLVADRRA